MIDLNDCTFLIPTYIDSDDRMNNIKLVVQHLTHHFKTNIFIGEQTQNPMLKDMFGDKVKHFHFTEPGFNRQKLFNDMCRESKTKVIVCHDTDVIFPVKQLLTAYNFIRRDEFDMIYPYDGKFYQIWKAYHKFILETNEVEGVPLSECRLLNPNSYGGSIFFNKEKFIEGGMENENFKGWGCEDIELQYRFEKLGYRQARTTGILYHLEHIRAQSPFYTNNSEYINQQYFNKFQNYTTEQLKSEVETWSWKHVF